MKTILIVEDNEKNMKLVRDILRHNGHATIEATTGGDGVRLASERKPDLILMDVRNFNLTGKKAEHLLDEVGITTNKNAIPFDPEKPFVTSGVRIGTAAVTSRGMDGKAMEEIAQIIGLTLKNPEDENAREEAKKRVARLTETYPLYPQL